MPSTRQISMKEYDMSREECMELRYFCLQYPRKKRSAAVGTDPARRARDARDVRLIETAARRAGDDLAPWLLRAVTTRSGVQAVFARDRPPIGERQFYALRRRFFWELKRAREGVY